MPDTPNNIGQITVEPPFDLELLQKEVGQRFPFYDMKSNINTVAFFCRIDEETLEEKFESLRLSLIEKKYIPMIKFEQGEHIIYVIKKPESKKRKPVWINIILLVATVFTTTLAGALQWVDIDQVDWTNMFSLEYLWQGLIFFSIPLMLILGMDCRSSLWIPCGYPCLIDRILLNAATPTSYSIEWGKYLTYLTITPSMDTKPVFNLRKLHYSSNLVRRMGWHLPYGCQPATRGSARWWTCGTSDTKGET